jgi:replicative DNA helicase
MFDKGAEEMLLGAFLLRPELMREPWAEVPSDTFYGEANRTVYGIMRSQMDAHGYVGVHTVMMDLRLANKHELCPRVPGVLTAFCEQHPETSDIAELCASRLADLYRSRETDQALAEARQQARDGKALSEVQMGLEALLSAINSTGGESVMPSVDELLAMMDAARVETGYTNVDRQTGGGMTNADLNVLAAPPSTGKSAFARAIIRRHIRTDKRVYWLSQDQSLMQICELELAYQLRQDTRQVRALGTDDKRRALQNLYDFWGDRLVVHDKPLPLMDVVSHARRTQPDFVVVDYLQLVDAGFQKEYENITETSKRLKGLAQELNVPVLALSQFNNEYRNGDIPSLRHLRGSGQIGQDAAQVWALVRDVTLPSSESQPAKLHILKNKTGPTGVADLVWVARLAAYEQRAF